MVTLGTLFYVFYLPGRLHMGPDKTRLAYLQERKDAVSARADEMSSTPPQTQVKREPIKSSESAQQ